MAAQTPHGRPRRRRTQTSRSTQDSARCTPAGTPTAVTYNTNAADIRRIGAADDLRAQP